MRWAAVLRSATDSGSPFEMFADTDWRNTWSSAPSKNLTSTASSPLRVAAPMRCMPSTTRMVGRCTRTGGRDV